MRLQLYRHRREENLSSEVGADQPAHCAVWSAPLLFAFTNLSSVSKLATGDISISLLVSVAEETGLSLVLSETPTTGFLATRSYYDYYSTSHMVDQWKLYTHTASLEHSLVSHSRWRLRPPPPPKKKKNKTKNKNNKKKNRHHAEQDTSIFSLACTWRAKQRRARSAYLERRFC